MSVPGNSRLYASTDTEILMGHSGFFPLDGTGKATERLPRNEKGRALLFSSQPCVKPSGRGFFLLRRPQQ
jgi:hypothetical protein